MDSFRSVGKIRVFLYQMHSVVARMLSRNVLRGGNRKENLALLRLNSVFFSVEFSTVGETIFNST